MKAVRIAAIVVGAAFAAMVFVPWAWDRIEDIIYPQPQEPAPLIPVEEIVSAGVPRDGIPALTNPPFVSVAVADEFLDDEKAGILVEVGETARFYPYQILVWHEVVNDIIEGVPVLVSYSPLTWSPVVFERMVRGGPVEFGASGKLYNSNLLMYNRSLSETLWSQYDGRAVAGPLVGEELHIIPSIEIQWKKVKERYPKAQVLSTETGYARNYDRDPYAEYYVSDDILFDVGNEDGRLHPKERVIGFDFDGTSVAYTIQSIPMARVIKTDVAGRPIVIVHDAASGGIRAFSRQFLGEVLNFNLSIDGQSMADTETATRWSLSGTGLEGRYDGQKLEPVPFVEMFWFAWAASHPLTELRTL